MSDGMSREAARELARLLARRLRERDGPADGPMTVAELRRELLPYPRCREAAGLASKAEYDLAVLDLLAAPGVLRAEDPELAEAVDEERAAAEPGLGFLEGYAAATLRPGPALAGTAEGPRPEPDSPGEAEPAAADPSAAEPAPTPEPAPRDAPARDDAPAPADASPVAAASPSPDDASPSPDGDARGRCRACGGEVPDREGLRYCPWCGVDLTASRCGSCGEELEPDWSYCPACGAAAPGPDG